MKLLGVTLDRTLHFGHHCRALRERTRPRLRQLRKLTGRSWDLEERQLRTIAQGYVRDAMKHAAAAWLPAAFPSHVELLEREMRATARIITDCPLSTPAHAVMAEADWSWWPHAVRPWRPRRWPCQLRSPSNGGRGKPAAPVQEHRGLAVRREERVGRRRDRWSNRADGDPPRPAVARSGGRDI